MTEEPAKRWFQATGALSHRDRQRAGRRKSAGTCCWISSSRVQTTSPDHRPAWRSEQRGDAVDLEPCAEAAASRWFVHHDLVQRRRRSSPPPPGLAHDLAADPDFAAVLAPCAVQFIAPWSACARTGLISADLARPKSWLGKPLRKGVGRGVSVSTLRPYNGAGAEVEVSKDGAFASGRVVCAVDAAPSSSEYSSGAAPERDHLRHHRGSPWRDHAEDVVSLQSNFHDYQMLRMSETRRSRFTS